MTEVPVTFVEKTGVDAESLCVRQTLTAQLPLVPLQWSSTGCELDM